MVRQRIHVHASVVEVSRICSSFLREGGPRIHRSTFPLWEVFCSCGLVLQWIPVPASVYALFSFFLRATYIRQSMFSDCLARGVQENWMEMTIGVRRIRRSPLDSGFVFTRHAARRMHLERGHYFYGPLYRLSSTRNADILGDDFQKTCSGQSTEAFGIFTRFSTCRWTSDPV